MMSMFRKLLCDCIATVAIGADHVGSGNLVAVQILRVLQVLRVSGAVVANVRAVWKALLVWARHQSRR